MIATLSQVCSLNSPFEKDIEDYAAGKCASIELWLGKLESYLERKSTSDVQRLLAEHGIAAPVASYQGGILASQGEQRQEAWALFERRLNRLPQLGVETLVVACDAVAPLGGQDIERIQASLKQAAQAAAQTGIRLALEFQATSAFGNNLQTAVALVDEVGSDALGLCLDSFHFYVGPSKLADLGLLTQDNLFHVQLSDVADIPRELATDSHRILPGEGDIPTDAMIAHLKSIGYGGCVSIEVMNPRIWQVPSRQFGEIAMTALRKVLGLAEP